MGFDEHPSYIHICSRPILERFPFYRKYRPVVEKFGLESRRAREQLELIDQFDKRHGNFVDFELCAVIEDLEDERREMVRKYYQIAFEEGMKFDLEVKRVMSSYTDILKSVDLSLFKKIEIKTKLIKITPELTLREGIERQILEYVSWWMTNPDKRHISDTKPFETPFFHYFRRETSQSCVFDAVRPICGNIYTILDSIIRYVSTQLEKMMFDVIDSISELTDSEFLFNLHKRDWKSGCSICLTDNIIGTDCPCGHTETIVFRPCGHCICANPCFTELMKTILDQDSFNVYVMFIRSHCPLKPHIYNIDFVKHGLELKCPICRTPVEKTFQAETARCPISTDIISKWTDDVISFIQQ
jgi:hypothetical protein